MFFLLLELLLELFELFELLLLDPELDPETAEDMVTLVKESATTDNELDEKKKMIKIHEKIVFYSPSRSTRTDLRVYDLGVYEIRGW